MSGGDAARAPGVRAAERVLVRPDGLAITRSDLARPVGTAVIERLRDVFAGPSIGPADAGYDEARAVLVAVDRRPAAVALPRDGHEVAALVAFARGEGLPIAVRSGGHGGAGHGTVDGGLVIDLRAMRAIEIDADARTAWAQAGATTGEVTAAAGRHGLAIGFGDNGSVGIGGLTLGGGVGYLSRLHGLTIDNLVSAEVVTADGAILTADTDRHPDLFWALRGGGGNVGIATAFRYRLAEVGTVVGGTLVLPARRDVLAGVLAAADAAPDHLTAIVNVTPAPPLPWLPPAHHGAPVIMVDVCVAGGEDAAEAALAPLRATARPLADAIARRPYRELIRPLAPGFNPAVALRSLFIDRVGAALAPTVLDAMETGATVRPLVQLRVLGGAIDRVPAHATAYAHRGARVLALVAAFYDDPHELPSRREWVEATASRLGGSGAFVSFMGDEGPERVRAAYPGATGRRLAAIKARYDPGNVFRLNQNVPPA